MTNAELASLIRKAIQADAAFADDILLDNLLAGFAQLSLLWQAPTAIRNHPQFDGYAESFCQASAEDRGNFISLDDDFQNYLADQTDRIG